MDIILTLPKHHLKFPISPTPSFSIFLLLYMCIYKHVYVSMSNLHLN